MNLKESSVSPRWHQYRLEDRHAPWKVFLPLNNESVVLGVGLKGSELASLANSWREVFLYKCVEREIEWAMEYGNSLGIIFKFRRLDKTSFQNQRYSAIAVDANSIQDCDPATASSLLSPGGSVVWVGSRRQLPEDSALARQGYQDVRKYAFIPSRTGKILLSLKNKKSVQSGLRLYTPGKWHNRIALRMGKWASNIGLLSFLSSKQVLVAKKSGQFSEDAYLLDWLNNHLNYQLVDATIYSGWTKLVLQLLDSQGHENGIAKISDIKPGRLDIQREIDVLKGLSQVPKLDNFLPRLLLSGNWQKHIIEVQSASGRNSCSSLKRLSTIHIEFLNNLSQVDKCEMPLEQWSYWPKIMSWLQKNNKYKSGKEARDVCAIVESCAVKLGNKKIPFHRVHGDFTPWNMLHGKDRLIVVDWEHSIANGLPFHDFLYFIINATEGPIRTGRSIKKLIEYTESITSIGNQLEDFKRLPTTFTEIGTLAIIVMYMTAMEPHLKDQLWA